MDLLKWRTSGTQGYKFVEFYKSKFINEENCRILKLYILKNSNITKVYLRLQLKFYKVSKLLNL